MISSFTNRSYGGESRSRTYGVSYVTDLQSADIATSHISPFILITLEQHRGLEPLLSAWKANVLAVEH